MPDLEHVAQQQEHQEGRLSTLEAEVRHVVQSVNQVAATLDNGFRETREMIQEGVARSDRRTSEIHERLDKASDSRRWNPTLTVALLTLGIVVGSVFVSFVLMKTQPMEKETSRVIARMSDHVAEPHHAKAGALLAATHAQLADQHLEIEKLHRITDKLIDKATQHAYDTGFTRAQVESLRAACAAMRAEKPKKAI